MAVPANLGETGPVTGQDLSHPRVVTASSAPVPGLYYIPMSVTSGGSPQTQQNSHPSSRSASNTEGSQTLQERPSFESSEPEARLLLQSREIGAPRNPFPGQADVETTSFTHWGVEILYGLRCSSRRSVSFYKGWCIKNACSPHKQLNFRCNTSKTISDPFRKQECEWCWPENQRKQQEISKHCKKVSQRALNAMFIICGIFLFCSLVIAIILATRMLRRRRRDNADRTLEKHASNASLLQKEINRVSSHWFPDGMSYFGRSSKAANIRVHGMAISKRSPGEAIGQNPWYKSILANPGKPWGIGSEKSAPGRLRVQKKRTKPLDREIAIGDEDQRVPVLPPAPPAISPRVFSDIENMGQGSLLSDPGTDNSHYDALGKPRRSARQSRAVSSGSEQTSYGATDRRDAGVGVYNLQRLTERS